MFLNSPIKMVRLFFAIFNFNLSWWYLYGTNRRQNGTKVICTVYVLEKSRKISQIKGGHFLDFLKVLYTKLHLPRPHPPPPPGPKRLALHLQSDALIYWLDLIHCSARSHPQINIDVIFLLYFLPFLFWLYCYRIEFDWQTATAQGILQNKQKN